MKKLLLVILITIASQNIFAQVMISENFSTFTIGDVGTDFTGVTPTDNIFTIANNGTAPTTATNAGNSSFQIVANDINHGNVLQITGTNGDKGSRQLWYDGFEDQWSFRDAGNDILEVEYDLYTGNTTGASLNTMGLYIYDATRTKILGGFSFNTKTLVLSGVAYFTNASAPIGNYLFFLGTGAQNLVLQENVWVRLGVSFNKTTGQVRWKGPSINGQVIGAAVGTDPDRTSLVSTSGTTTTAPIQTNTAAATGLFDNFIIRASATDTLLGVEDIATIANDTSFLVYPNPATTTIAISSKVNSAITAISITDMNGRIVKNQSYDNLTDIDINVSDLSNGMYFVNIATESGNSIQKIMKN
jgi:hypothetical protein